jgi:hypothetical protein
MEVHRAYPTVATSQMAAAVAAPEYVTVGSVQPHPTLYSHYAGQEPTVIHHVGVNRSVGVAQPLMHNFMAPSSVHVYQDGTHPYPAYNNEVQAYSTAYPNYLQ